MTKQATLYRMITAEHICPYGIKSKALLEREGYVVEDQHLQKPEDIKNFKLTHNVKTTPQTFIGDKRIGGYDDLRAYFGLQTKHTRDGSSYQPILAVFSITFVMALAATWAMNSNFAIMKTVELFVAFSMCVLAILKLQNLDAFSNQFLSYDLLAQRYVRYAYVYPFAEAFVGLGMIANLTPLIVSPVALFIGSIGAVSVIKAVYIDQRDIKCACVGGDSKVPLGFISLTENLMMVFIGIWMLIKII